MVKSNYIIKKLMILILLFLIFSINLMGNTNYNYDEMWKKVDNNLKESKLKDAILDVETIYNKSKDEKNDSQYLKSIIYQMRFINDIEEDEINKIQKKLKLEIDASDTPVKNILHSMLAEVYWSYYRNNLYSIVDTNYYDENKNDDIRTWNKSHLIENIVKEYELSLENSDNLLKEDIKKYTNILTKNNNINEKLRPTLYDLLLHRAVDFYLDSRSNLVKPVYEFYISNEKYFSDLKEFINYNIETEDIYSFDYKAISLIQKGLINKLKHNDNEESIFDLDLKRMKFVYNRSIIENKDKFYINSLEKMYNDYINPEIKSEILYERIVSHYNLGNKWNINAGEKYRFEKQEALKLCDIAIKQYNKTKFYSNIVQFKEETLLKKNIEIKVDTFLEPNKKNKVLLTYKNIENIEFSLLKIDNNIETIKKINNYIEENQKEIVTKSKKIKTYKLPKNDDLQEHKVELILDEMEIGSYILIVNDSDNKTKSDSNAFVYLNVSAISFIERGNSTGSKELFIVNRTTGNPIKNSKISIWSEEYDNNLRKYILIKNENSLKTDDFGYIEITQKDTIKNNIIIEIENDLDKIYLFNNYISQNKNLDYTTKHTNIFTDRAVYKPGQTVYFKGISFTVNNNNPKKNRILTNENIKIRFYDANNNIILEKSLITNEFGTFHGDIIIPNNILNGQMRISSENGEAYIQVEEYKRPKFEVVIQNLDKEYKLDDEVVIKAIAKSYSGESIDNVNYRYRVIRESHFPYRSYFTIHNYFNTTVTEIANGNGITNKDGEIEIKFNAVPDYSISKEFKPTFTYTAYIEVIDKTGEQIKAEKNLNLSYESINLNLEIDSLIKKESNLVKIKTSADNFNETSIDVNGVVKVYKLKDFDTVYKERIWENPDTFIIKKEEHKKYFPNEPYNDEDKIYNLDIIKEVFKINTNSDSKTINIENISKWELGMYKVEYIIKDKNGNEIKTENYFTLYSDKSDKIAINKPMWVGVPKKLAINNEIDLVFGSNYKNVWGIYEIIHRGTVIKREFISINKNLKKLPIKVLDEFQGNFGVSFTFIKNNRLYNFSENIVVPWDEKKLNIEFESFRDNIAPGEKEEWTIKVSDKTGNITETEMLALMYDASLDSIIKHNINKENFFNNYYNYLNWSGSNSFSYKSSRYYNNSFKTYDIYSKSYESLNWFGLNFYPIYQVRAMGMKMEKISANIGIVSESDSGSENSKQTKQITESKSKIKNYKIRENFNETAFFYPNLKSDKDGKIIIKFKVPDSLTRWRILGFANTKDLKYGFVEKELTTSKQVSITTNNPRFLVEEDIIYYPISIKNNNDVDINGTVELTILDGYTLNDITKDILESNKIEFNIESNLSKEFLWKIKVPKKDMLIFRVVANSLNHSDGEENLIPVLKNRILVTETLPINIRENESKTFKFDNIINKADNNIDNYKLTFEYTANPVWDVVQSLPYLMEYPYESSDSLFSRYYANKIAYNIISANPNIERVYNVWKNSSDSTMLISNLEKNQELKKIFLEATPWLLDGKTDSDNKKRIAMLFDKNKMEHELEESLNKLYENQLPSGGWGWFKGMRENRYITQYIVTGFAKLGGINNKNEKIDKMIKNALKYLDEEMLAEYKFLKKNNIDLNNYIPDKITVNYLYARSLYNEGFSNSEIFDAFNYFKNQIIKNWKEYNYYEKAMIAISLNNYDNTELAVKILESVKEYALYSEESGMYWKLTNNTYWNELAIETQSMLITAFDKILNDQESVKNMKVWLLKHKEVNNWESTKATVEACSAIINTGDNWLLESKKPNIKIGEIELDSSNRVSKEELGSGYIKTTWNDKEINSKLGEIEIKNNNKIPAWGGVYYEYYDKLDNIDSHEGGIKITKTLYKENYTDKGISYSKIGSEGINIGDIVKVRIDIEFDRDMEYIHLRDMRASGLEPYNELSGYQYKNNLHYYKTIKDSSIDIFFDFIGKGKYTFEYNLKATHKGEFVNGVANIQSMYAPAFSSHTKNIKITIN